MLVTDADLLGAVEDLPSTGGATALGELYQDYFDMAFGKGRLQLEAWYTTETLAGGRYVYRRFWSTTANEGDSTDAATRALYRPHVMTGAGSVFVCRIAERFDDESLQELSAQLQRVCRFGLTPGPLLRDPDDPKVDPGHAWKHHPWLPAQGFGEILLQPKLDLRKGPEASNEKV
jgi:hypothetical protein